MNTLTLQCLVIIAALVYGIWSVIDNNSHKDGHSLLAVGFSHHAKDQTKATHSDNTDMPAAIDQRLHRQDEKHYGIDISHFQGNLVELIDKKSPIQFIICKATQGTTFLDPDFRSNWREIRQKGFIRGAYHFYDNSADPIQQAAFYGRHISDMDASDIPPILDIEQASLKIETSAQQLENEILDFLQHIEKLTGRKPMLYTNYAFAQQHLSNPALSQYRLWLADYNGKDKPSIPDLWKNTGFSIWQRSDNYHTDAEQTDLDVVFGPLKNILR